MSSNAIDAALKGAEDDSYSIIERLADAIRIEDDFRIAPEERARIVQDLYEGPRKCQCCINWVDEVPPDVELETVEKEEETHPLILRRRILPGEEKSNISVHSIEVRDEAVRKALFNIFEGYDSIVPDVKYLVFMAPFKQFFWRWEVFEKYIEEEEDEHVKLVLQQLRVLVKAELAEAFAVSKELISHGVITYKYLWTLFSPGELLYADTYEGDRLFILDSSFPGPVSRRGTPARYDLNCLYVDWDGFSFGLSTHQFMMWEFKGTRKITELLCYPARFLPDLEAVRAACIERGRKFTSLGGGIQYKAYRPGYKVTHARRSRKSRASSRSSSPSSNLESDSESVASRSRASSVSVVRGRARKPQLDRRIILDTRGHPSRRGVSYMKHDHSIKDIALTTGLISQAPVDATPMGGHQPLPAPGLVPVPTQPYPYHYNTPPNRYNGELEVVDVAPPRRRRNNGRPHAPPQAPRPVRRDRSVDSNSSRDSDTRSVISSCHKELTEWQLQLCGARMLGYCLKQKGWRSFNVDGIVDIEWNTAPFESLVLPEGYKDLVLSFVENQLKDGDTFDDVINGKGGGMVILLAGDPGVGKTLTAESVAEKIHAPLFKMELGHINDLDDSDSDSSRARGNREAEDYIVTAFELAAKWKAVLLIDECDLYLEKRSEGSAKRNRLVSRFLQELEYYPSLLFLTTNRERVLDPAIYSRIHLTINYPGLDGPSRRKIWETFLGREGPSEVTDQELDRLAAIEVNGRKIRNLVKTARIMAKQQTRAICFDDVKKVMRITEGLTI